MIPIQQAQSRYVARRTTKANYAHVIYFGLSGCMITSYKMYTASSFIYILVRSMFWPDGPSSGAWILCSCKALNLHGIY